MKIKDKLTLTQELINLFLAGEISEDQFNIQERMIHKMSDRENNEVWITGSIIKNNMQAIYNGVDVTSLILKQMEGKMSRTAVERELKKIKNIEKTNI